MSKAKTKSEKSAASVDSKLSSQASVQASCDRDHREAAECIQNRLVFHCQLAHGSPTGIISGFKNVSELYEKIAECFDINSKNILFCTLNTHKIEVQLLLGGQLGLDDLIFAHVRGRAKVVEIEKTGDALGLTITDNGAGLAFIKGIKEKSIMGSVDGIYVGDHIEKINGLSLIGCRHFEVAKILREMPKGQRFTMRLIEPQKSGFSEIGVKAGTSVNNQKSGTGTLRLRAKGVATIEQADLVANIAIDKINTLLEDFLGISDSELAQSIWEVGRQRKNPSDFALAVKESDLKEFAFKEAFIFDLWGAITDAQQGRLKGRPHDFREKF